ncbi:hypothetical protein H4219_000837 [Mycoemilia scoparia]|uniref:MMS19 nucleotide excision repair protein n=1 Tax=Mycoemilia scoparia TaxID=417184 RepID=A0A9W8A686_9FUNG|nr:hypothetical protein H4219_000837 [Mycoemilia scoparia]
MSDARLVEAAVFGIEQPNNKAIEIVDDIASSIESGKSTLLHHVQLLQSYLTSDASDVRSKGTQVLSLILTKLSKDAFQKNSVSVLVTFLTSRLSDPICVPQLLDGIHALSRLPFYGTEEAKQTSLSIFKDVHVQSFQQRTRNVAFQIIEKIVKDHPKTLKQIGDDFVLGLAQMVDGEKDPRNLMIVFQIIPALVERINIQKYAEDLFEVIFCYFPITFRQKSDDPFEISPDDLKVALRNAIISSPYLTTQALKPLIEKIEATSANVKVDVLDTVASGADKFDQKELLANFENIVDLIREDIFMTSDERVLEHALGALTALYASISSYKDSQVMNSDAMDVEMTSEATIKQNKLDIILDEANVQLTSEDLSQCDLTGKIVEAVARSCAENFVVVFNEIAPILFKRFEKDESLVHRRQIIVALNRLLKVSTELKNVQSALVSFHDRILAVYRIESSSNEDHEHATLHTSRLRGIQLLILLDNFLTDNEKHLGIKTLTECLVNSDTDDSVHQKVLSYILELADIFPNNICTITLPELFKALKSTQSTKHVDRITHSLKEFGTKKYLFSNIEMSLIDILSTTGLRATSELYVARLIQELTHSTLENNTENGISGSLMDSVATPILQNVIRRAENQCPFELESLKELARAISFIVSASSTQAQSEFIQHWLPLIGNTVTEIKPKDETANISIMTSAILCSLDPKTIISVGDMAGWIKHIAEVARQSPHSAQRQSACEIIASVINKTSNSSLRLELANSISGAPPTPDTNITLFCWVIRALAACKDKIAYDMARSLLTSTISQIPKASAEAIAGYNLILASHPWAVTRNTKGVLKLLYQQRFYSEIVPTILQGFPSASKETKTYYLMVLSRIFQHVPKTILMHDIEKLLPLLIEALRLTDPDLKSTTLETISMVISEVPNLLRLDLTSTIIPLHLESMIPSAENSIAVRCSAVKNVRLIADKFTYQDLQPAMYQVLKALAKAADDHKRLVRQEVVKCRTKWLLLED